MGSKYMLKVTWLIGDQDKSHSRTSCTIQLQQAFLSALHFSLTKITASSLLPLDIVYFYVLYDVESNFFFSCVFGYDLIMGLLVLKFLTKPQTVTTNTR